MKKIRRTERQQQILILVFSYIAAIALSVTFNEPTLSENRIVSVVGEVFWNLKASLRNTSMQSTLLFFCLAGAGLWLEKKKELRTCVLPIVSIFIAIIWLMGESFRIDDTLDNIHSSDGQVIKSIIYVIGIAWIINEAAHLLLWFLHRKSVELSVTEKSKIGIIYDKHPFAAPLITLIIGWLHHIIIAYPGYACLDSWNQLIQFYGEKRFTSHHPPAHTVLMGLILQIGTVLKDGEFGIFLFILFQMTVCALVLAYTFYTMKKLGAPQWLKILSLVIGILLPYYSAYVNVLLKDNLYSYIFLLFMTELVYLLTMGAEYFKSKIHLFLWFISVSGVLLFRNNGKYVLYPFIIVLLGYYFIRILRKKENKAILGKAIILMMVPVLCSNAVNGALISRCNIEKGSIREALSIAFQQTARYVSMYGDEVTEEEKEAISAILDYENLPENYDPRISDPVKSTFNDNSTQKELINYLLVWLKQFFKHPLVYVEATMNQNYYILYPIVENDRIYYQTYYEHYKTIYPELEGFQEVVIEDDEIQTTDAGFQKLLFSVPVIGLLCSLGFYNLVLIAVFIFAIYKKTFQWILLSIPLILSNAIIVLAPVIQGHPRYAFPIIYSMPIVIAYYLYLLKGKQVQEI